MKNLFLAIALILGINLAAQDKIENTDIFVRVYDLQDKKIGQGKILSISDTTLQLKGRKEVINVNSIGLIRTKRSVGNNILIGALSGAAFGAIIGIASADPDAWLGFTAGEGAVIGISIGGAGGAGIGAISALFKKSNAYIIDGDQLKFKEFNNSVKELKQ